MLEKGFNVAALRNQISNFRCQKWLCLPWKQDSNSGFMDKYTQLSLVLISPLNGDSVLFRKTAGRSVKACQSQDQRGGCWDQSHWLLWPFPFEKYEASSYYFEDGLRAGANHFFSEWLSISHTSLAHFGCWSPTTLPTPSAQATWDCWSTRRRRGWEWGPGRCRAVGRRVSNNSGPPPDLRFEKKALGCRTQLCKYEGEHSFSL